MKFLKHLKGIYPKTMEGVTSSVLIAIGLLYLLDLVIVVTSIIVAPNINIGYLIIPFYAYVGMPWLFRKIVFPLYDYSILTYKEKKERLRGSSLLETLARPTGDHKAALMDIVTYSPHRLFPSGYLIGTYIQGTDKEAVLANKGRVISLYLAIIALIGIFTILARSVTTMVPFIMILPLILYLAGVLYLTIMRKAFPLLK